MPNSDASSNPGTPCLLIDRSVGAKQMEGGEGYEEDGKEAKKMEGLEGGKRKKTYKWAKKGGGVEKIIWQDMEGRQMKYKGV